MDIYVKEEAITRRIYISQDETGIRVYDQWEGKPVHERVIKFKGGRGAGRLQEQRRHTLPRGAVGAGDREVADNEPGVKLIRHRKVRGGGGGKTIICTIVCVLLNCRAQEGYVTLY